MILPAFLELEPALWDPFDEGGTGACYKNTDCRFSSVGFPTLRECSAASRRSASDFRISLCVLRMGDDHRATLDSYRRIKKP